MLDAVKNQITQLKKHKFLFEELVKRDFKKKYKRTALGMVWSLISPLMQLLIMSIVFTHFFGRDKPHYTIYLFAGNLTYAFFKDSTYGGMSSLMSNAGIITKINLPKYMFLLSKNVASLINFGLTLIIFFIFAAVDGVVFHFRFLMLIYPIITLIVFNIGCGFILSALFVIFKDIQYLYDIFTLMLMYLSAIFYYTDTYPENVRKLFYLNPLYVYITYIRHIVLDGYIPGIKTHALCLLYALLAVGVGAWIYKKYNYKFLYYM
ncbi:MAG: ABC transporter permease [Ruminococcus sp.]|jgi:ABC-2 type transport system permease protein|nr:ABC transporter permease [Ruminococcus sp.]MBQ1463681.1 ABC transporter permease [Ruminococcus sp.]MBQ3915740.1 ABC transporter permease [Ruminococcus sp.]